MTKSGRWSIVLVEGLVAMLASMPMSLALPPKDAVDWAEVLDKDSEVGSKADLRWLASEVLASHERCRFSKSFRERITHGLGLKEYRRGREKIECLGRLEVLEAIIDETKMLMYFVVRSPRAKCSDEAGRLLVTFVFDGERWLVYPLSCLGSAILE